MEKKYTYENAVVYVVIPDEGIRNVHKATETFLRKVIKEKRNNGNINTCGIIGEKQILDR